jgi:hypothetical protein
VQISFDWALGDGIGDEHKEDFPYTFGRSPEAEKTADRTV